MRTLFGASVDALSAASFIALGVVLATILLAAIRNPLLPRLAARNLPRRPGLSILITVGLGLSTVILSTAFVTGDTMSLAVRSVVAGALGPTDEVVFIPAARQQSGADLAQSVANGTFLTGNSEPFPVERVASIQQVLQDQPNVAAVVPALLQSQPVGADSGLQASMNLIGVATNAPPGFGTLIALDGSPRPMSDLQPGQVYVNQEAASDLGLAGGSQVHLYQAPDQPTLTVRDVVRNGDLGGAQSAVLMPLAQLQGLTGLQGQVDQVLVLNQGSPADRLAASWPIVRALRDALMDDATAQRLFKATSNPNVRQAVQAAADHASGPIQDKLRAFAVSLAQPAPTDDFKALVVDPDVLFALGNSIPGGSRLQDRGPAGPAGQPGQFQALDVQQVAQTQADLWGSAFTDLFVVLGLFSLASGVLLITLVFSLLALERRSEHGMLRAMGGRRLDVILLLATEGGLYSLASSLLGLGVGLGIGYALVWTAAQLVASYGFQLVPSVEPRSLLVSYSLGVAVTFVSVTISAWRASRFSIVSAIRELPDPSSATPSVAAGVRSLALLVFGVLGLVVGADRRIAAVYAIGVVLALSGLALSVRWLLVRLGWRQGEWLSFTLAGLALAGWWLVPTSVLLALHLPVLQGGPELGFLSGIGALLGLVWVGAYNVGVLRGTRSLSPLWRLSVAYVASHRFRTGMTLLMFGLVVMSLTLAADLLSVTSRAFGDPAAASGGWDVRADSTSPPTAIQPALSSGPLPPGAITAVGSAGTIAADALQLGTGTGTAQWAPASVLVVDAGFASGVGSDLTGHAAGDPRTVWQSLVSTPGAAIVGAQLLAERPTGFRLLDGEGSAFRSATVWVRDDRATGEPSVRLQVVGIADGRGPFGRSILVGPSTLAAWAAPRSTSYYAAIAPGQDARTVASEMALALPDMRVQAIAQEQRIVDGVRGLMYVILEGFMGVGLVAGVTALGIISLRSVVERRRHIGVVRAIGFSARAVGVGLLLESGLVAVGGTTIGVSLGLLIGQSTVTFLERQNPQLRFAVPWDQLGLIALAAIVASLVLTLLPALQAARLSPAQALRE